MKQTSTFVIVVVILLFYNIGISQDIHFSQFQHTPQNINPALTGVFKGDIQLIANYRNQWASVPVDYKTFSAAYDTKLYPKRSTNGGFFGAGLLFNNDAAGDSRLSTTNIGLSGAYILPLSDQFFISAGVQGAVSQRAFDLDDLSFDSQYNGEAYDPSLSKETFPSMSVTFGSLSAGINFHLQGKKDLNGNISNRSKLDVGGAIFHINEPGIGFIDKNASSLSKRIALQGNGVLMISPKFDAVANALLQYQGTYGEKVFSLAGRFHLNQSKMNPLALQLGVIYRLDEFSDAIAPAFEVHFRQWMLGLNYDINISDFNIATSHRSGPEIALRYYIERVKPLPVFRICPII